MLLSNHKPSILQKERLEILELLNYVLKHKKLEETIINRGDVHKKFFVFYKKIQNHTKKYHWLHNDFAVIEYLDEKYFIKVIRELIINKNKLRVERNFKNHFKQTYNKRNKLIKSKKISPQILNIVNLLLTIAL